MAGEELTVFIMGKNLLLIIMACFILCGTAYADQPAPEKIVPETVKEQTVPFKPDTINTSKLFSLGRGIGASYYYLIDLCDKTGKKPFSEIQQEYARTFQNINIIDIILEDLEISGKSRQDLKNLRINFYNALKNQDLSETHIAFVRDLFVVFYENLSQDISAKYCLQGNWLLSLGFYSAFQLESLKSPTKEKVLLSGFDKIFNARPVAVPEEIYTGLVTVNRLDKMYVTTSELALLESNLIKITEYFTNYPVSEPVFDEAKNLIGVWQGILVNPENERHDIRLIVNKDLSATMDVAGIAEDINISEVEMVNNYFTFMFKPFGTEKLYLRFDAKLSENMFTGEITDVTGSKGYWILAKTNDDSKLSEDKLDKMISYIAWFEEKLKEPTIIRVNEIKIQQEPQPAETSEDLTVEVEEEKTETIEEIKEEDSELIEELYQAALAEQEEEAEQNQIEEKKSSWCKFVNFLKKIFMIGNEETSADSLKSISTLRTPLFLE